MWSESGKRGELVPPDRLDSAPHLLPFCLVRKKHRRHPWPWDTHLIPTEYSLMNVPGQLPHARYFQEAPVGSICHKKRKSCD